MSQRFVALIPAGGVGARAGVAVPKQYAMVNGEAMIVHTIRALLGAPEISTVQVVLGIQDTWDESSAATELLAEAANRLRFDRIGGATRAQSVVNGLDLLANDHGPQDWVLVHDAARPCVTPAAVTGLIRTLAADAVGGLLALPVADTVKRADRSGRVEATVARDRLWLAQTPQMFRLEMLRTAYRAMSDATDEAGAIEALGLRPVLVMGEATNLKVTYPGDFAIAEAYLGLGSTNCPGNVPARPPTSVN